MNPWTLLIMSIVGWGTANVLSKAVLNSGMDTVDFLPLRYGVGLITLILFLLATGRIRRPRLDVWKKGVLLGVVNMAVPTVLMTLGLEYIPATVGSLLIALVPISTVLAANFVVPGERFQPRTIPGLLVSFLGVGFLISGGRDVTASGADLVIGASLTVAGVILAGVGGAVSRRFAVGTSPSELVLPQFVSGLGVLLIGLSLFGGSATNGIEPGIWWLIIASGTVGTTLPFAAFLFAAEVNPASRLAITGYAVPVVATAGAVIFLNESLTSAMLLGALLIIAGVFFSERSANYVPGPDVRATA